ncbi:MAG: D-alanyl-D-alanine carboxypeptidase [Eubacteriales bacterium]|nr:D-alanyl-D-alanine carboxypeptidase [Eubacteriales bacterium]
MLKRLSFVLAFLFIFPLTAYGADNSARSAIVIDAQTMKILYEKNAYEERSIASTTKIMTALLAVESGRLDETVTITEQMVNVEGSSLGLKANDTLTLYDLLCGMMLTSGNDSANAVAEFIDGSKENFAVMMNRRADEIGMKNSYFVTPSGLDEGNHHSTAYDMALLTAQAIKSDVFCDIVSKQCADIKISGKDVTVYNHNRLLSADKDIFGVKTGYTDKAGRCLVSAKNYQGNRLICVTLCCPDDWNDHLSLYDECEKMYSKATANNIRSIAVVGGQQNSVNCSYSKEFYTLSQIDVEEYYFPFIYAPVRKGDKVGEALVYCNNKLLERLPIEADEDVEYYAKQQFSTTSKVYG